MNSIFSFVHRLCEPHPKSVPDPIDQILIFRRNKTLFWIFFCVMLSVPFLITFAGGTLKLCFSVQTAHLINLLIFISLCRSHLWVYHVFFVALMVVFPFIFMKAASHLAFIQIGHTLVMPMFVLLLTNSNYYALLIVTVHILTAMFKTKSVLLENMEIMPPEMFINTVVHSGLAMSLGALLMFSINFASLNKRTREVMLANKAAEDLLEMQKTFLFSFSHEMRNPLNSLLGNLELALMETLPHHVREMVRTAQICSELLVQQINNVLDTGKHELGHLEINLSQVKVFDMFMQVWALSNELIRRRKLKSIFKIDKNLPKVLLLDSHRVNQIMMNLIGNALKFTEKGSINVEVKWQEDRVVSDHSFEPIPYDTENEGVFEKNQCFSLLSTYQRRRSEELSYHEEEEKEYFMLNNMRTETNISRQSGENSNLSPRREAKGVLKIVISDTGCGMSEESLKQLFQKFSQVSNDPNKRKVGTGLGLFITKEICTKMEADIRVYSKLGKGTTFIICIPTMSVSTKANVLFQKNSAAMYNLIGQRNLKCIVADDSPLNIAMVCNFLDKINIKPVSTAINGEEAVNFYKQNRQAGTMIDLVTLDIDMPKMDGKTACQKIREFEKANRLTPAIIILISGNYAEEQIGSGGIGGANYFLKKPLKFEEFSSTIFRLIENI